MVSWSPLPLQYDTRDPIRFASITASRFPDELSTKASKLRHRVRSLEVNYWWQMGTIRQVNLRAVYLCGNGGGTMASPLMERPDLPLCGKCVDG